MIDGHWAINHVHKGHARACSEDHHSGNQLVECLGRRTQKVPDEQKALFPERDDLPAKVIAQLPANGKRDAAAQRLAPGNPIQNIHAVLELNRHYG